MLFCRWKILHFSTPSHTDTYLKIQYICCTIWNALNDTKDLNTYLTHISDHTDDFFVLFNKFLKKNLKLYIPFIHIYCNYFSSMSLVLPNAHFAWMLMSFDRWKVSLLRFYASGWKRKQRAEKFSSTTSPHTSSKVSPTTNSIILGFD